jgi:FkbM family methyltransferase
MLHQIKTAIKSFTNRAGYRILSKSKFGIDWIDDCITLSRKLNLSGNPPFDVMFDVGANTGQTALELVDRLKPLKIHCFEPVTATFNKLASATAKYKQISCYKLAMSDTNGEAAIHLYEASVLASLCDRTPILSLDNKWYQGTEIVATQTLDTFLELNSIKEIDILKIDTEGADHRVLLGAKNSLKSHRIKFIVFEFYQISSSEQRNGVLFDADQILAQYGYRFVSAYTDFVSPEQPTGIYNALYCKWPLNTNNKR